MNFEKTVRVFVSVITIFSFSGIVAAQVTEERPVMVSGTVAKPQSYNVAAGSNLYCAGFIQSSAMSTANRIIGGQDEADKYIYAQNDFVYLNMGNNKGVNVGDVFSVVRPRGSVKSKFSDKGNLGFYVQEVGAVEVIDVKQEVSVAHVKFSCDNFLLGDLVQLTQARDTTIYEPRPAMDRFGDPSGKATGRIVMARDAAEMLARDFVAYVDLGADENVRVGDHLTIFRGLEKGNLGIRQLDRESISSRDYGFESNIYKGGKFSNQAGRKSGEKAGGQEVTTYRAKRGRPYLRKVVGEAVVINVKEKTATIVITRTGQEIHTGDWVELQ